MATIVAEFEKELLEEIDVEKLPKSQRIRKNIRL